MCINIFTRMGVHRKKVKLKEVVRWGYIPFLTKKRGSGLQENNCREVISLLYWRRQWHPTPVLLPGKSHGRRSLVGCSPWGRDTSRTRLSDFTFIFHFHALEEMATHSSVLAWRIPGTGEPGGLPSMESHRVGHDWSDLAAAAAVFCPLNLQIPVHWTYLLGRWKAFTPVGCHTLPDIKEPFYWENCLDHRKVLSLADEENAVNPVLLWLILDVAFPRVSMAAASSSMVCVCVCLSVCLSASF